MTCRVLILKFRVAKGFEPEWFGPRREKAFHPVHRAGLLPSIRLEFVRGVGR